MPAIQRGEQAYNGLTRNKVPFEDAVHADGDRWFIKMGFAGFNSRANNGVGYVSQEAAMLAVRRYQQA